jgi:hypothetical protein
MIQQKMTMMSITSISMRNIAIATHLTCVEEEFYDAYEFLDFDDHVDDLLDTVNPEAVSEIYGIH